MKIKYGDRIKAIKGTTAELLSEGRIGIVKEVRDSKSYRGNDSNNLVQWGDDTILCGFHPEDVEKLKEDHEG